MQIIRPVTITDSLLTSSNVPENDYAQWSSSTTYSIGNRVIVLSTHKIYESASNSNLNNNPTADDGTNWLVVSATNRWKAFDQKISDPVVQANSIQYVITTTEQIINSLAFFGVKADTIQIVVEETSTSTVVYNETYDLLDTSSVIDWYTYFFEPASDKETELLVINLPSYATAEITVTISESGSNVELGQMVLGKVVTLGKTGYGTTVGIEDFSRKERDTFGNPIIIERAFAQTADYEVELNTQEVRRVQRLLAEFRATPIVWIGNPDPAYGLIVYGFYNQFTINLSTPSSSYVTLEVEGLT